MKTLRTIVIAMLLASAPLAARADDPSSPERLQAATELFAILSGDMVHQLLNQVTNAFWPVVEQKAHADKIDDATIAELRKQFESTEANFVNDAMKGAPAIYARHFTVAELHDLAAFYRTPTGVKALQELPKVMGEFSAELVPHMQDLQQQLSIAFNNILREHGYIK